MKTPIYKLALIAAFMGALALSPQSGFAQEKKSDKAADKKTEGQGDVKKAPNQNRALPFRGKVDAVDKKAKTITVGSRVMNVTAETKFNKDGKTVTLADLVVGEPIRGSFRQSADGKLTAITINLGQKPAESEKPSSPAPAPKAKPANESSKSDPAPVQQPVP